MSSPLGLQNAVPIAVTMYSGRHLPEEALDIICRHWGEVLPPHADIVADCILRNPGARNSVVCYALLRMENQLAQGNRNRILEDADLAYCMAVAPDQPRQIVRHQKLLHHRILAILTAAFPKRFLRASDFGIHVVKLSLARFADCLRSCEPENETFFSRVDSADMLQSRPRDSHVSMLILSSDSPSPTSSLASS